MLADLQKLAADLKRDEGVVSYAYKDSLGFWTIGVGRLIDKIKGGGLSENEIDYLLANDIRKKSAELQKAMPWVSDLTEARQRALLNMAFQLGVSGLFGFKNMISQIKAGKYADAAASALDSKWAKQAPERAARIAAMIETGAG